MEFVALGFEVEDGPVGKEVVRVSSLEGSSSHALHHVAVYGGSGQQAYLSWAVTRLGLFPILSLATYGIGIRRRRKESVLRTL